MDPCEHHFTVAVLRKRAHLADHVFHLPAPHPSPCIRYDAVGAELIAAVLYLDVGSRVIPGLCQREGLIVFCPGDVFHFFQAFSLRLLLLIFLEDGDQILFPVVPEDNVNAGIDFLLFCLRLDIAPRRDHNSVRIHLARPVEHLARFPVRDIGHSTCIYNIDIRALSERDDLISSLFQHLLHCFCLICIYLASKVVQRRFFHIIITSFCSIVS